MKVRPPAGRRGLALLRDPLLNKGTAFTATKMLAHIRAQMYDPAYPRYA